MSPVVGTVRSPESTVHSPGPKVGSLVWSWGGVSGIRAKEGWEIGGAAVSKPSGGMGKVCRLGSRKLSTARPSDNRNTKPRTPQRRDTRREKAVGENLRVLRAFAVSVNCN